MRKFVSLVCASLIFMLAGCDSRAVTSFAGLDRNVDYVKSFVQTSEACTFELDPAALETSSSLNITVYESESGKIVLTGAEITSVDSKVLELHFRAYGVVSLECSTIITACTYGENGFLQSPITVEPTDYNITKYSLMTSEFEDFGNVFSVIISFERSIKDMDIITVTLQDLYLVKFSLI